MSLNLVLVSERHTTVCHNDFTMQVILLPYLFVLSWILRSFNMVVFCFHINNVQSELCTVFTRISTAFD